MARPTVFVSYSGADKPWAREFAESLTGLGASVWLDERDSPATEEWPDDIDRGLRASDLIVLVLDREGAVRPNVLFELGAAIGLGKRVVPVMPEGLDASHLPEPLRHYLSRTSLLRRTPVETARAVASASVDMVPEASSR